MYYFMYYFYEDGQRRSKLKSLYNKKMCYKNCLYLHIQLIFWPKLSLLKISLCFVIVSSQILDILLNLQKIYLKVDVAWKAYKTICTR